MLSVNDIGKYDFLPDNPVDISNPLLWKISASCTLHDDQENTIQGRMIKGTGSLNGINVGEGLSVSVKDGDQLKITASALAKVEITNKGTSNVHADCGLSESSKEEMKFVKSILQEMLGVYDKFLG